MVLIRRLLQDGTSKFNVITNTRRILFFFFFSPCQKLKLNLFSFHIIHKSNQCKFFSRVNFKSIHHVTVSLDERERDVSVHSIAIFISPTNTKCLNSILMYFYFLLKKSHITVGLSWYVALSQSQKNPLRSPSSSFLY